MGQLTVKDPEAKKDWGQEEKGPTEDEMVGWYHRLMDMSLSKLREIVKSWETGHAAVQRVTKSQTRLKRLNSNMGPIPLAVCWVLRV